MFLGLGVPWAAWICEFVVFIKLEKFGTIWKIFNHYFFKIFFCFVSPFSLLSSGNSNGTYIRPLKAHWWSVGFFLSLCISLCIVSTAIFKLINLSSAMSNLLLIPFHAFFFHFRQFIFNSRHFIWAFYIFSTTLMNFLNTCSRATITACLLFLTSLLVLNWFWMVDFSPHYESHFPVYLLVGLFSIGCQTLLILMHWVLDIFVFL